jgi:putative DNA primase/helicase
VSLQKAVEALSYIGSDERDIWVMVGMSLKAEFGDSAFDAWDAWSRLSDSYNHKSAKTVWKSFRYGGKTTIASLFHLARQSGWRDSGETHVQSPEEIRQAQEERRRREQQALEKEQAENRKAAAEGERLLKLATITEHAYLRSKQLPEVQGLVLPDAKVQHPNGYSIDVSGALFVPMRDCRTGELNGGQMIKWNEEEQKFRKLFIPGMKAWDSAYRIGSRGSRITVLCEGYATGLSIQKAAHLVRLDASVLVCFSAGNVANVAGMVKGRKGIYADHDASGAGEKAAIKAGVPYVMSQQAGNDANDDMNDFGMLYVAQQLLKIQNMQS